MIKYSLICEAEHGFEGWFRNSGDFEAQQSRSLVTCPVCGSCNVSKRLMAPAVATSRKKAARPPVLAPGQPGAEPGSGAKQGAAEQAPSGGALQPSALLPSDLRQKELVEALRQVRARIVETSENVGADFASEARKIHYGEADVRNIYGETTPQDAADLVEEGIAVLPLPDLPEEKN